MAHALATSAHKKDLNHTLKFALKMVAASYVTTTLSLAAALFMMHGEVTQARSLMSLAAARTAAPASQMAMAPAGYGYPPGYSATYPAAAQMPSQPGPMPAAP